MSGGLSSAFDVEARRRRVGAIYERECFKEQLDYIHDSALFKAALCTRRAGKTSAVAAEMAVDSQRYPGRVQAYCGLTKDSAQACIWHPDRDTGLEPLLDKYGIEYSFLKVPKVVEFANGSTIKFLGIDATPQEMKKSLGGKVHRVVFDECQDYKQDVSKLIYEVFEPAATDYVNRGGGFIEMCGTPGEQMGEHLWWLITKHDESGNPATDRLDGWKVHEWSMASNPWMRDQFHARREEKRRRNPEFEQDPGYRRQWLGKWVLELDTVVYRYDEKRNALTDQNLCEQLLNPMPGQRRWTYVLGADLGYVDASAFVVCAYSPTDHTFYVVESEKVTHTPISKLGKMMQDYVARFGVEQIVIDAGGGAGKLTAMSFAEDFGLPIVPAEKLGKENTVGRMNSDFLGGRVKVIVEKNAELIREWQTLRLDERLRRKGEWKEAEKHQNHGADACLLGGTMVETTTGPKAIETVAPGDIVFTRQGPRAVLVAKPTRAAPIWRLTTASGRTLHGTADHRIWTENGWVELANLTTEHMLTAWVSTAGQRRLCSVESGFAGTQSHPPRACATTSEASEDACCIGSSGPSFADRSPGPTTSTTSTRTRSTTHWATSSASRAACITASICASLSASPSHAQASTRPVQPPQSGTARQQEGLGTPFTGSRPGKVARLSTAGCASSAESRSGRGSPPPACARPSATQRSGETLAWTTCSANAAGASECFWSTSIASRSTARDRVARVERTQTVATVYNMTVDEVHEYFADGILVANCLYAHRASLHQHSRLPAPPPKPDLASRLLEQHQRRQNPLLKKDYFDEMDERASAARVIADFRDGRVDRDYEW